MALLVALCGAVAALVGAWRGYEMAREAIGTFVHDGDPTRLALEAARPLPMRPRVRLAARRVAVSLGWLVVSLYGLYLVTAAGGIGA